MGTGGLLAGKSPLWEEVGEGGWRWEECGGGEWRAVGSRRRNQRARSRSEVGGETNEVRAGAGE